MSSPSPTPKKTSPATQSDPAELARRAAAEARSAFARLAMSRSAFFAKGQYQRSATPAQSQAELNKALPGACELGELSEVRRLLDQGANPNWRADTTSCAVYKAAKSARADALSLLFERGAKVPAGVQIFALLSRCENEASAEEARRRHAAAAVIAGRPEALLAKDEFQSSWGASYQAAVALALFENRPDLAKTLGANDAAIGKLAGSFAVHTGAFDVADRLLAFAKTQPWRSAIATDRVSPLDAALSLDRPEALFYLMERGFCDAIAAQGWRLPAPPHMSLKTPLDGPVSLLSYAVRVRSDRCAHILARTPAIAAPVQSPTKSELAFIFTSRPKEEGILIFLEAGFDASSISPFPNARPWIQQLCDGGPYEGFPMAAIQTLLRKRPGLEDQTNAEGRALLDELAHMGSLTSGRQQRAAVEPLRVFIDKIRVRDALGGKRGSKAKASTRL